ncbi:MAG: DUF4199 domain-containing protein [Saprospiraceae bacterium]
MNNILLKNGLIAGILAIIISIIVWMIDPTFYLKSGPYFRLVVIVFFMYKTAKEIRDLNGGFINLADLFKATIITAIVATILILVFNYIHYNFIDTNLVEIQKQIALESISKMTEAFGNEDMVEEIADKIDEQDFSMTFGKLLQGWAINLIFWAIVSLIISAVMKKKDNSQNEFA